MFRRHFKILSVKSVNEGYKDMKGNGLIEEDCKVRNSLNLSLKETPVHKWSCFLL